MGDFNTPLTPMDRSAEQKINKETQTLNDKIDQLDLIVIYRTFHPKTIKFTFFSSTHGTFSRIDHNLGCKSSLGKFKKFKIIPSIFSDHNAVRLDVNYKRKTLKIPTYGGRFLITLLIPVLGIGMFSFFISSWFSLGRLCFSKNLSILPGYPLYWHIVDHSNIL